MLKALADLQIDRQENRPAAMRLLRGRLEANLSGLLGPAIAHDLIDRFLPYSVQADHGSSYINVIESRIEAYRSNLSGMAADLDNLRRAEAKFDVMERIGADIVNQCNLAKEVV